MLSSSKIVVCTLSKIKVSHVIYATAAQSLQSCLTLCNPIDDLLPGSPTHGILQARTLEWVADGNEAVISHDCQEKPLGHNEEGKEKQLGHTACK